MTRRHFRSGSLTACFGLAAAFWISPTAAAQAQESAPPTHLQRFVAHFDLGLQAFGEFTGGISGTTQDRNVAVNPTLNQTATSSVGFLATVRAQRSPYVGGEFNFGFSRYSQVFTFPSGPSQPSTTPASFQAQNTANEYTLGYVARPQRLILGAHPAVGGGGGVIDFKPSKNGGAQLPNYARPAYYYQVSLDKPVLGDSFGFRIGFRQLFYQAPDFGENYLRTGKYTSTYEPSLGLYYHF